MIEHNFMMFIANSNIFKKIIEEEALAPLAPLDPPLQMLHESHDHMSSIMIRPAKINHIVTQKLLNF